MQLLIFNEEFLVRVVHQTALITSLPLVHTARRYYRLDGLVSLSDCGSSSGNRVLLREVTQTLSSRGSKSRNKVSVGEPAEGSLTNGALNFSSRRVHCFIQTPLVDVCLHSLLCANRTYATTWQWSGTTGLERSEAEHPTSGHDAVPSRGESLSVAVRCKGHVGWSSSEDRSSLPFTLLGRG